MDKNKNEESTDYNEEFSRHLEYAELLTKQQKEGKAKKDKPNKKG